MIELAKKQNLEIEKKVEFGVYLTEPGLKNPEERVLLPKKQVPKDAQIGNTIEVFVYRDSEDRMIATVNEPKLMMGQIAWLQVKDVNKFGAFLDWGLEKDLFLPFKQQIKKVDTGDKALVTIYIDKSNRLCATTKLYHYLHQDSPYKKEDRVNGTVYEISDNFGVFVAVDDIYSALIPKKEVAKGIEVGQQISARVVRVLEDGKLELSVKEKAYLQMDTDAAQILELIKSYDGVLPFQDKASPELIKQQTGMSKNEFKRAVGKLLKEKKITITDKSILLNK